MMNRINTRHKQVTITIDGSTWSADRIDLLTVADDAGLKRLLEARGGKPLPPNVYVHLNRNGNVAVARFTKGAMPPDFVWPEDEVGVPRG